MNYYTADLHLGYEQILRSAGRPFADTEEMDRRLLSGINERCRKGDTLYILGDVSYYGGHPKNILRKMKPELVLITGNHDRGLLRHSSFRHCFADIRESLLLTDSGYDLYLSHYPLAEWDGFYKGRWLFYGHVHRSTKAGAALMEFLPTAVHAGTDVNGFVPRTAEELIEKRKRTYRIPCMEMENLIENTVYVNPDDRTGKRLSLGGFQNV